MKTRIILNILRVLIGKNSAHIARKVMTFVSGLFLASALFTGEPQIIMDGVEPITKAEIEDGLTIGETLRAIMGILGIMYVRSMSFFRARKLDWLAEWIGMFIGRSAHSLYRAALTVTASFLAWAGFNGDTGTLADQPLVSIVGTLIALGVGGLSSYFQDSKQNPVETSPPKNQLPQG